MQIAWSAISFASAVSKNLQEQQRFISSDSSLMEPIGGDAAADLPEFVGMDLIGHNVIGEKRKIYKSKQTAAKYLCIILAGTC